MKHLKRFNEEFDYDEHKKDGFIINDRVIITINIGTDDVIKVEGLLAETDDQEMLYFKPTSEPLIYKSSNSQKLITDKEISFNQSAPNTQRAAKLLIDNIGNWMGISSEGVRFYKEIKFGQNINTSGGQLHFIGTWDCLFLNIKFDKV
jgi:hypothetical protein